MLESGKNHEIQMYHVDFEKRGECGVVARERHESRMSQIATYYRANCEQKRKN